MALKKLQLAVVLFLLSLFSSGVGTLIYLTQEDPIYTVLGMSASILASIVYFTQGIRVVAWNKEEMIRNTVRKPEDGR